MLEGRRFYKMSGSGNDFVFFDLRDGPAGELETIEVIRALCARGTGIGADGVVFLDPGDARSFGMRYYNSDGSLGELCGNATLCALHLASTTGSVSASEVAIGTDAGEITARMSDGLPEIDLAPVDEVVPDLGTIDRIDREERLGFARAGVPHVVIIDRDIETAGVVPRGSEIRRNPALRDGANVNFLSERLGEWAIRTYERGVEGETLACGTGAVASAILLIVWGRARSPVRLRTRSGQILEVRARRDRGAWHPSLKGAARIVFVGQLGEIG